jgi:UDP-N-acetylmuramate dehydrogenase
MDYSALFSELKSKFPDYQIFQNHPLASYTTLKIGGPADIFIDTSTVDQFTSILNFVYEKALPLTILGNGSNVLISDSGIRGLVVKNSSQEIKILESSDSEPFTPSYTQRMENEPKEYLDFSKLNYDESYLPTRLVYLSSGTFLTTTITYLIEHGLTGLQWFAYIPATIGGAVWNNIHGGSYHFADYIHSVEVFNLKTGQTETFKKSDLSWQYDKSFFQQNPHLIILSTTLRLFRGDTDLAKKVVQAWINQKSKVQPMNSAGSTFANPSLEVCQKIWGEQKSAGWIIDHEHGWKGKSIGGAQVSEKHANFIVNTGNATASDFYTLATSIQSDVLAKTGISLEFEIKLLGQF